MNNVFKNCAEGIYLPSANIYISIDEEQKQCYMSDCYAGIINHSSRGLLIELAKDLGEEIHKVLDVDLEDYGVKIIDEVASASQEESELW